MVTPPLHFRRVQVRRMPGVDGNGFTLDGLSPGINVIYGPNGCGKSRTAEAINTLLWPAGRERVSLAGSASLEGADWRIDLDAGAVGYQRGGADSGPPHLPSSDARDRYNLPLHELLRDDSSDFAETILRESAGGYDLKRLAEAVGARPGASGQGREFAAVKQSAAKLKEAEDAQRRLLDDEQRLADLEEQEAAAARAAARAELLSRVLNSRDAADALDAARAALAQFEPGVARLRGDELQQLGRLRQNLQEARAAGDKCRGELDECAAALAKCRAGGEGIDDATLKRVAARQQRLNELRSALDAAGRERAAADAERAKARARIAPAVSDEHLARMDCGGLGDVEAFARELAQARAQADAQAALAEWVGSAAPPPDLDASAYGLRLLWRWLQTPEAPAFQSPVVQSRAPLVAAAVLILLLAAALAITVHWALAAAAIAAGIPFALARRPAPVVLPDDPRPAMATEFVKLNIPGPSEWTADEVAAAADRLAQELAAARVEDEKAKRWAGLASRRDQLKAEQQRLEVRRTFMAAHLGVPPATDGLSLVALASNIARWQDADARLAAASAKYDAVLEQYHDEVATAAGPLREHGFEVRDASDVAAAVEALRERRQQFELAAGRHAAAAARAAECERLVHLAAVQLKELFEAVGLADRDEATLRRWCQQRAAYIEAEQAVQRAAVAHQLATVPDDDARLRDAPRIEIESELLAAREEASKASSVRDDAVAIRTRIADAKKAANVEEALSRHGENLAALTSRRADDCGAVAAFVLTEYLRRENRDRNRPAVFHRARELFSSVTQGRYRLEFDDATEPPTFRATDTSTGAGHSLDEVSSGTRLQLLLAVRVAFVEEQERGVKLPLLLDETLANSDEKRARAIIDATVAIARSGRQVFYFTAQLDEVAKWKSVLEEAGGVPHRLIDLAEVRGLAATERLPLRDVAPLAAPEVPEPVGLSRAQYAALLQVPAFDPNRPEVGGTHLWHLIEDPRVLHRFLTLGVNTWGQLKTLGEFNAATLVNGSREALRSASAAARALEAMAEAWRVGRGRPVDRQAVRDSGAVTDKFVEPVCALLPEVGHDGSRLVEALLDGRVKNFRKESAFNLRTYFSEHGHIDERPRLSYEQVRARMLAAVSDDLGRGGFDARRIDEYLASVDAARQSPAPMQ